MSSHRHLGTSEVAALLDVSRQRVHQLRATYPDFPQPADELAQGPVWHADDVKGWQRHHAKRQTGVHVNSDRKR